METFISPSTNSIQILVFTISHCWKTWSEGAVIAGTPYCVSYVINADILIAHSWYRSVMLIFYNNLHLEVVNMYLQHIKHPNRAKQHHCGHANARRARITNLTMHFCGLLAWLHSYKVSNSWAPGSRFTATSTWNQLHTCAILCGFLR